MPRWPHRWSWRSCPETDWRPHAAVGGPRRACDRARRRRAPQARSTRPVSRVCDAGRRWAAEYLGYTYEAQRSRTSNQNTGRPPQSAGSLTSEAFDLDAALKPARGAWPGNSGRLQEVLIIQSVEFGRSRDLPRMTETEWREFLAAGTRTGKLATTRLDGRPHVVPVWFVLDGDDLVFNTGLTRSRDAR